MDEADPHDPAPPLLSRLLILFCTLGVCAGFFSSHSIVPPSFANFTSSILRPFVPALSHQPELVAGVQQAAQPPSVLASSASRHAPTLEATQRASVAPSTRPAATAPTQPTISSAMGSGLPRAAPASATPAPTVTRPAREPQPRSAPSAYATRSSAPTSALEESAASAPSAAATRSTRGAESVAALAPTPALVRIGNGHIPVAKWHALEGIFSCWARNGTWVGHGDEYNWTPARTCQHFEQGEAAVQAPRICQQLQRKTVLFVGDSVQRQIWRAFALTGQRQLVEAPPRVEPCTHSQTSVLTGNTGDLLCRKLATIYHRNDRLYLDAEHKNTCRDAGNFIESNWTVDLPSAHIVVLNRGAHFEEDHLYVAGWERALAFIRGAFPSAVVVARTTPAGSFECWLHKAPLKAPLNVSRAPQHYHWDAFSRQNEQLRRLVSVAFPGVLLYDVEHMASLRPDVHQWDQTRDCLHFGGPHAPSFMASLRNLLANQLRVLFESVLQE